MRKLEYILLIIFNFQFSIFNLSASVRDLTWYEVCAGKMPTEWYGSAEAQGIADTVIAVQKNNGGWMKNDQLHLLSEADYQRLINEKNGRSCLDNTATTQEMRFLARVWKASSNQPSAVSYQQAFLRGLNRIFIAQKGCGGWSQYLPLTNDNGYQDYVTFNDDLMTNVLKMLRDMYENQGVFENITDAATRTQCETAFNRGLQCILDCQINIDGTYAAWGAQHDTVAPYLPTEGRPHELPSVSGYESANLLSFLMTIDEPSETLKSRITAAVNWLDAHKIADHAVEDYTNANGEPDRRIVEREGTHLWGRFIQIGGNTGTQVYNKLFNKLKTRGKKRSYAYNGVTYTYTEEELARANYDASRAYQPIYAIYKDTIQHMYYRFLYNYEDSPIAFDSKGCPYYTSLLPTNRASYQYIGSWCQRVIETEYPAWMAKHGVHEDGLYILSAQTCVSQRNDQTFTFNNAFVITNEDGAGYSPAKQNAIRYSADVTYTIQIPADLQVTKVQLRGYCNYDDLNAHLAMWNNTTYADDQYIFPHTEEGDSQWITYYFDHSAQPVTGELPFRITGRQTSMVITLTCVRRGQGLVPTANDQLPMTNKVLRNGQLYLMCEGRMYDVRGCMVKIEQ